MDVSLQDLRYLCAIAEHESLSAAGESLGVSQPALSKCLKRLERIYGAPLVDWSDGRSRLTEIGEVVMRRAEKIIHDVEEIPRQVTLISEGINACVRIGLGPYVAEVAGRTAVARYIRERPRARVDITIAAYDQFVPLLRREHLDFYIADVADAVFRDDVQIEDVAVPRLVWVCRAGHPLLSRGPVDARMLTEYPIASTTPPMRFRKWLMDVKRLGVGPDQIAPDEPLSITCDNGSILREVIGTTDCVAFTGDRYIRDAVKAGRVALVDTDVEPPKNRIAIVRRTTPPMSAGAARLIELFREEFARFTT